ncbi:DUF2946 domain-containing protein [Herbaspirillum sp. HC18]|nr:DUF2946 domain-containing protein [Herbaspirillum sp. HC18]
MKKLLLIFLLVLLPLQFCWAAAAAYCQHEGEKSAQHFGHHSHKHDAKADLPDNADKGGKVKIHVDCGYCHLSCQVSALTTVPEVVLPTGSTHVEKPARPYSSHIPDGLQRPDWHLVA